MKVESFVEIVFAESRVELEPFVVEDVALDDELFESLRRPDAEPGGLGAVDAVARGNDGVEAVEFDFAANLAIALGLNS